MPTFAEDKMIIFGDNAIHSNNICYKVHNNVCNNGIVKNNVKQSRRPQKLYKITKSNKEFLQALGFKL